MQNNSNKSKLKMCQGKLQFEEYDLAVEFILQNQRGEEKTRAYRCWYCKAFHLSTEHEKYALCTKGCGKTHVIYRGGNRYCGQCKQKLIHLKAKL